MYGGPSPHVFIGPDLIFTLYVFVLCTPWTSAETTLNPVPPLPHGCHCVGIACAAKIRYEVSAQRLFWFIPLPRHCSLLVRLYSLGIFLCSVKLKRKTNVMTLCVFYFFFIFIFHFLVLLLLT